ncbi:MAG: hypothetical protein RI560_03470 [Natronomonas sp.]|uniref:hypothetical protein n=1 Tax=Natronomonas sp. TaxID=2184060 RepID=UPI00286FBCC1|nr:hypothetical protein [Natronomonas sp.]MDR9380718.1 hypothetical protein [Natronomonas sp.]MDR9431527.1 hypothetical protein [Natronomonas sp.]
MSDDRFDALEARLDALSRRLEVAEEQNEWLEAQLHERDAKIDELREDLTAVDERTELMNKVQRFDAGKPTERAAVLIQTLRNRAIEGDDRAALDVQGALDVLRLDKSKRTLMYETFEKAEAMVDDPAVLTYKKENQHADKNSRLAINLTNGDVPKRAAGFDLHAGMRSD